jgi:hypothetical protein
MVVAMRREERVSCFMDSDVDFSKVDLVASGQQKARNTRRAPRKAILVPPLLMLNWTCRP